MKNRIVATGLAGAVLLATADLNVPRAAADPAALQYLGKSVRDVPLSPVVRVGNLVFVSGTPGFDAAGKLAAGDFATQMKQPMDNVTAVLKSAGAGWDRVGKVNVMLVRREDFADMNRIYAGYFPDGRYPARTTTVVSALPQPDFLVEIECEAVVE
jgi:enamine deaminase RidA (YjgF/YER057c/UK114 family)